MTVRQTIIAQFEQVAAEQHRKLARLSDEVMLPDSGLDSLSFAVVIVRLEEALGVDPFSGANEAVFPETLGDFVKAYENSLR